MLYSQGDIRKNGRVTNRGKTEDINHNLAEIQLFWGWNIGNEY